jgi:hypothetical protein
MRRNLKGLRLIYLAWLRVGCRWLRIQAEDLVLLSGPFQAYGKAVEGAMRLWEVRRLWHEPDITLAPTVSSLTPLFQPVPVHYRLFTGKQIAPGLYQAMIMKLSFYSS